MTETVADIIKDWLDREQRPQTFLARQAGINEVTLVHLLQGRHKAAGPTLRKLEKAMGLPLGTLEAVQAQQALELANGREA